MTSVSLYFKVHQPWRLKDHKELDSTGKNHEELKDLYFDTDGKDKQIFNKVARKCYYPANDVLLKTINKLKDRGHDFKLSFSLTGTFIEQCRKFDPEVLQSFKKLVDTGNVEILGETYYHSLASLYEDPNEFKEQVRMHRKLVKREFGQTPKTFSNTEALYNNRIASLIEDMGFEGVLTEGADRVLGWRSPNYVYTPPDDVSSIPVLMKNYRLSDDIAFRFSAKWWDKWPLTADKFSRWVSANEGDIVNLFMDYETFGEHHWADSGIFSFLKSLPHEIAEEDDLNFKTPQEAVQDYSPEGEIDVFEYSSISWADNERDETAWLGNWMQKLIFEEIKSLEPWVKKTDDENLLKVWRYLQTSDHLYYLSTKGSGDGDVHSYFSSFDNEYRAFRAYLEALKDFKKAVFRKIEGNKQV